MMKDDSDRLNFSLV